MRTTGEVLVNHVVSGALLKQVSFARTKAFKAHIIHSIHFTLAPA